MTWNERRTTIKLRRELERLRKFYEPDLRTKTGADHESLLAEYFSEQDIVEYQLREIESRQLVRRARRWFVDIPTGDSWDRGPAGHFLTQKAADALRRAVRDERRKEIKWWAELVMPILALLVALACPVPEWC